ncbi:DUF2079 domain-containing protein [Paraliomyxa miuraensis]|uniref:DUF2079 domain-containing protein n=1 Tax=Paraliomyxa miuraensis TaxID=376150 RepID=UPI00224EADED|nr:DUF2079 domain-containing protein [Paraliomyxa miuraensis]MCX4240721.1 DUF2079 domain-containing protein [Paraliomyxa miuraensis]
MSNRGTPPDSAAMEADAPAARMDETSGWAGGLLAVLAAVGPGLAWWAASRSDPKGWLTSNALLASDGSRIAPLGWALGSAVVVFAVALVLRRRGFSTPQLLRIAVLPATAPLWALLTVPGLERDATRLSLALIAMVAIASGVSASAALGPGLDRLAARGWPPWWSRRVPTALVVLATVAMATMLCSLGLLRHHDLGSRNFDLGIFDNLLHHASLGRWQVTTFLRGDTFTSAHVSPVMQLLGPLYWVAPGPGTLITVQCVWLASGAIPAHRLATHVIGSDGWGRLVATSLALAYLMHPSLHGTALFDAHALVLSAPLVLWSLDALHRGQWRRYAVFVTLLVFVREDVPFLVMGLGLHAALTLRERRVGALTFAGAVAGLLVMKLGLMTHPDLFMPNADDSYRYANRFAEVIPDPETGGATDVLVTLLGNPGFVVEHALTNSKLKFLSVMAVPCVGLCFVQRRAWLPMAFGLLFALLSTGGNLHDPYLHYTVFLYPAMIAAAAEGARVLMRRWSGRAADPGTAAAIRRRSAVGLSVAIVVAAVLTGDLFGALGDSTRFKAGYVGLVREQSEESKQRLAWVRAQVERIGPHASVAASDSMGPHVSTRDRAYHFPHRTEADWLLLRMSDLSKKDEATLRKVLRSGRYERVDDWQDAIVLWRRKPEGSASPFDDG